MSILDEKGMAFASRIKNAADAKVEAEKVVHEIGSLMIVGSDEPISAHDKLVVIKSIAKHLLTGNAVGKNDNKHYLELMDNMLHRIRH